VPHPPIILFQPQYSYKIHSFWSSFQFIFPLKHNLVYKQTDERQTLVLNNVDKVKMWHWPIIKRKIFQFFSLFFWAFSKIYHYSDAYNLGRQSFLCEFFWQAGVKGCRWWDKNPDHQIPSQIPWQCASMTHSFCYYIQYLFECSLTLYIYTIRRDFFWPKEQKIEKFGIFRENFQNTN